MNGVRFAVCKHSTPETPKQPNTQGCCIGFRSITSRTEQNMVNVSTKTKDLGSRAQGCARVSRGFIRALQSWQGFVHGSDLGLGRCLVEAVRVEGFRFTLLECGVSLRLLGL